VAAEACAQRDATCARGQGGARVGGQRRL
jgi:hypothetical protein